MSKIKSASPTNQSSVKVGEVILKEDNSVVSHQSITKDIEHLLPVKTARSAVGSRRPVKSRESRLSKLSPHSSEFSR